MKNRDKCPACGEPLGDWETETRDAFNHVRGHYEVNTGREYRQCCECEFNQYSDGTDNRADMEQALQVRRTTEATKERMA